MKILRDHFLLVLVAGILLIGLLYYLLVVGPAYSRKNSLEKLIVRREANLREMHEQKKRWEAFQRGRNQIQAGMQEREKGFTLLSFLEAVLRESGIDRKINYMKPLAAQNGAGQLKQEGIEIGLDDMRTEELVDLLYRIEFSGKLLKVNRIRLQRTEKGSIALLKVVIQINTYFPV